MKKGVSFNLSLASSAKTEATKISGFLSRKICAKNSKTTFKVISVEVFVF